MLGYMEGWPLWKRKRVANLLKSIDLPESGKALDFGCGKGEFTAVIKNELPQFGVEGTDVSDEVLNFAKNESPDCTFFALTETSLSERQYQFVFSHHVLEHVVDIDYSVKQISDACSSGGNIIHILPCGDKGCIENLICSWRKDGFNPAVGNRMFFEHPGHLRRLNSNELISKFQKEGFELEASYFANIFFGSIEWITSSDLKLIMKLTEIKNLKSPLYALPLVVFRFLFLAIFFSRFPVIRISKYFKKLKARKKYKVLFLLTSLFYLPSFFIDAVVKGFMHAEYFLFRGWSGSEMYLVLRKK